MTAKPAQADYRELFRNALMVGGGSVLNLIIGLVRTKFVAVTAGATGIALFGVFNQIIEVVAAAFSLGLGTSGIRQIADSHAQGDDVKVSRVVRTLRHSVWITGTCGALFLIAFSFPITLLTFDGQADYRWSVAMLGLAVLLRAITTGQGCVVQGIRRLDLFMRISFGGAIGSVLAFIPFAWIWGLDGIAPALVASALGTLAVSWWYSRKVTLEPGACGLAEKIQEARLLIAFGLPVMGAGLLGTLSPYLERVIMLRHIGIEQLGHYQAAYSLAGISATLVLGVMGAEFYPKLIAYARDNDKFNIELNAQVEVVMILSAPVLAVMAAFPDFWIRIFYTTGFGDAADALVIMLVGLAGRLFAAPIRLALLAKHRAKTVLLLEALFTVISLGSIASLAPWLGFIGCAMSFAALHLSFSVIMSSFLPKLTGQRISWANLGRLALLLALLAALLVADLAGVSAWVRHMVAISALSATAFWTYARLRQTLLTPHDTSR